MNERFIVKVPSRAIYTPAHKSIGRDRRRTLNVAIIITAKVSGQQLK